MNQLVKTARRDLWDDWIVFKKNDITNPALQLKKQGANFKNEQFSEFTYRPHSFSPPSMQEFYEGVINGIIKRQQLNLYKGEYFYYLELQTCLHEFIKLLNFRADILIEVFQSITGLNLSKEQFPNIVLPCASCGMYIYITYHCKKCFSAFYCDKTCKRDHKPKHQADCPSKISITPSILYALQVEIHCGGDLGDDVQIFFEYEKRISLKYRGIKFMANLYKVLVKNIWLKKWYHIVEDKDTHSIDLRYNEKIEPTDKNDKPESFSLYDASIQGEEDLYLKMPVIQELRVIFLNQGAILQDIIKETYEVYTHYIHVYYFPC